MSKKRYLDFDDALFKIGAAIIIILMVAAGLMIAGFIYLAYVFITQGLTL